jgi:hypothetical protein
MTPFDCFRFGFYLSLGIALGDYVAGELEDRWRYGR